MFRRTLFLAIFLMSPLLSIVAQDTSQTAMKVAEVKDAIDGINETLLTMKTTLDALAKIKISGYMQTQFNAAEGAGGVSGTPTSGPGSVGAYSGGSLGSAVASRFSVRRGRIKFNYDNDLTQYVLQIDVTQGGVGIKDAYLSIKEPWLKTFTLTSGIFDRPFGFEISYSSSSRETPERSRLFQSLFPGERELGMKVEVNPTQGFLSYFNLKAGIFNGVLNTANEVDNTKDFIGRLGFQLPLEEMNLAIDGGVSIYSGEVRSQTKYIYKKVSDIDSSSSNLGKYFDRSYIGLDAQVYYDMPVLGGASLRAEIISGTQPGTLATSHFYGSGAISTSSSTTNLTTGKVSTTTTPDPLYIRKFLGYYVNYIQNIGLRHQFVAKYDVYEPNTDGSSKNIGAAGSNMNIGDLSYTTIGLGWIYHWDANVKFIAYYEMITNDTVSPSTTASALKPFKEDIHDNMFTFRIQYKF
jgi:hypothetical protein